MEKIRRLGLITIGVAAFLVVFLLLFSLVKPKVAGIFIETSPPSSVLINGQEMGKTPFNATLNPGEVVVLLLPESFNLNLSPYETRVNLFPGVKTVIRREFGETLDASSGEIISFEKISKSETSLVVVSDPDSAKVTIDDSENAYTPYKTSSIIPGEHTLVVSAEGYLPRVIRVMTHKGFRLTVFVKLGVIREEKKFIPSVTPFLDLPKKVGEVEILDTPTGFLRVRETPSSLGKEIGKVVPKERYSLYEVDQRTGWFKVEFEEGVFGWISNQYARKIDEKDTIPSGEIKPSASPTIGPLF